MRPIDHFFSQIDRMAKAGKLTAGGENAAFLAGEFTALVGPVIGAGAADELLRRTLERAASRGASPAVAGAVAAFFLGKFDDETMSLEDGDWEDIRETLLEVSSEINMDTLTGLMQELLSRGRLNG
ncbi:MAG: hypothetical protein LBG42_00770 [Treponema sp.]|nr:hypothetical protein [Treponema sp.]